MRMSSGQQFKSATHLGKLLTRTRFARVKRPSFWHGMLRDHYDSGSPVHYSVHFMPRKRETKAQQKVGSARFPTRALSLSVASGFQSDHQRHFISKEGKTITLCFPIYMSCQACRFRFFSIIERGLFFLKRSLFPPDNLLFMGSASWEFALICIPLRHGFPLLPKRESWFHWKYCLFGFFFC